MFNYLSKKYEAYIDAKSQKVTLWDILEPYRRPRSFKPFIAIYIAGFYTGLAAAALTEQLYKEKYWEDHPGHEVPLMTPMCYYGPWTVIRGQAPAPAPAPAPAK